MATTSFLFITNYGRWWFSSFLTLLRTMTRSRVTTSKVICSTCRKGHVEIMTEVTVSDVDTGCSSFDWSKPPEAEVCDFSSICPCCVPCSQRTVSSRSLWCVHSSWVPWGQHSKSPKWAIWLTALHSRQPDTGKSLSAVNQEFERPPQTVLFPYWRITNNKDVWNEHCQQCLMMLNPWVDALNQSCVPLVLETQQVNKWMAVDVRTY